MDWQTRFQFEGGPSVSHTAICASLSKSLGVEVIKGKITTSGNPRHGFNTTVRYSANVGGIRLAIDTSGATEGPEDVAALAMSGVKVKFTGEDVADIYAVWTTVREALTRMGYDERTLTDNAAHIIDALEASGAAGLAASVSEAHHAKLRDAVAARESWHGWQLDLSHARVPDLAALIRDAPRLENVRELNLEDCRLAQIPSIILGEIPLLPGLSTLNLRRNAITSIDKLPRLPPGAQLDLSLDHNPLGDNGVLALAALPDMTRVARLSVHNVGMTQEGAQALRDSPFLRGAVIRDDVMRVFQ